MQVHKILGPGNQYVTAAKMALQNSEAMISMDMPAGPSEVLVIADAAASPSHVAADLLSQAEHGPDSQVGAARILAVIVFVQQSVLSLGLNSDCKHVKHSLHVCVQPATSQGAIAYCFCTDVSSLLAAESVHQLMGLWSVQQHGLSTCISCIPWQFGGVGTAFEHEVILMESCHLHYALPPGHMLFVFDLLNGAEWAHVSVTDVL